MHSVRRRATQLALGVVTAGSLAAIGIAPAQAAATAAATGNISVVHGLRGVVADVFVDGQVALQGFAAESTAGPIPLPAGPHDVAVNQSGAAAGSTPILSDSVTIPAGGSVSAVAHLGAQGQPNLTVFTDDLTALPAGQSRLVVRHTAQVDAVQVVVDGVAFGAPIQSAAEELATIPAGAHQVLVQTADGQSVMLPNQSVTTTAGSVTMIYLIGSADGGNLGWLVQEFTGIGAAPTGVPTGNSGLAAPSGGVSAGLLAFLLLLAALTGSVAARHMRGLARRASAFPHLSVGSAEALVAQTRAPGTARRA